MSDRDDERERWRDGAAPRRADNNVGVRMYLGGDISGYFYGLTHLQRHAAEARRTVDFAEGGSMSDDDWRITETRYALRGRPDIEHVDYRVEKRGLFGRWTVQQTYTTAYGASPEQALAAAREYVGWNAPPLPLASTWRKPRRSIALVRLDGEER